MKRKLSFLIQLLWLCPFLISCDKEEDDSPVTENTADTVDVHIVMGQSNAMGLGYAYELPPAMREPMDSCYIYNPKSKKFEKIHPGVNTQSLEGRFGIVLNAAKLLKEHQGKEVYFMMIGYGNTQLYNSGSRDILDWNAESNELVAQAKQTIDDARAALVAQGENPVFRSMAWWQGENDAKEPEMAAAYEANETAMFASFDEVAYLKDTKRVIYKLFTDEPTLDHVQQVNAAKVKRAASDPKTVAVLNSDVYARLAQDKLHAGTEGQLKAGEDFFKIIRNLK